jgi:hypothetical protein
MKNLFTLCLLILFSSFSLCLLSQNNPSQWIGVDHSRGDQLRVMRLAVSCTGEYTTAVGGVTAAANNIDAWLVSINEMYGREYCVRFELIPNNNTIIYPNAGSDPWPTMPPGFGCNNANVIHDVQATIIDNAIGAANYDISHVILDPNFNGGCAGGYKTGYSGGLDLPVTRHEMGHQFSQPHTISNGGNNNFELSGGNWSVQGGNGQPYAHSTSYHSLVNKIQTQFPGIGGNVATNNSIPTVDAGPDLWIPISTPFTLTGTASDANAGDNLTYVWDCMDGGIDQGLPMTDESQGALFMRLLPSTEISRTIPDINDIINNTFTTADAHLSAVPREMNVKLVVNDNHQMMFGGQLVNASGINADDKKIIIVNNGGPFLVINPNSAQTLTGGSNLNVTWNVNGTNLAPISTANVKISLSADGGLTYPIILANSTPNDGSHVVTVPNFNTTTARIKIEALGNIYFDISNANFTINQDPNVAGVAISISGGSTNVSETGQTDTYTVKLNTTPSGPVTIELVADSETEISLNGIHFTPVQLLVLNTTDTRTVTVRGRYDEDVEGMHTGAITHTISSTQDNTGYPTFLPVESVPVNISDAQIAPVVGIDFDEIASTSSPANWVVIQDVRTGSAMNIPLDDGTPSTVDITTTAALCGVGGCGFAFGGGSNAQHIQSLNEIDGASYAQGAVTFACSGLNPNKQYRVFVFGINFFGDLAQSVTITGSGPPVNFNQNAGSYVTMINDQPSAAQPLFTFGKTVTSTGAGSLTVDINPTNTEVSFSGFAIQEVLGAPAGSCPPNYNLAAAQTSTRKYETDGTINSSQSITGNAIIVTYDANNEINLTAGFEVGLGPIFDAYNDGCLGQ